MSESQSSQSPEEYLHTQAADSRSPGEDPVVQDQHPQSQVEGLHAEFKSSPAPVEDPQPLLEDSPSKLKSSPSPSPVEDPGPLFEDSQSELTSPQSPVEDPPAQVKNPQKTVSEPKREQSPVEDSPPRPESPQSPVNDPESHVEDPESEHESDDCNKAVEILFHSALNSATCANPDASETALSEIHDKAYSTRGLLQHGKTARTFDNLKKRYLSTSPNPTTPSITKQEDAANRAFGSRLWKGVNIARFVYLLPMHD